MILSSPGEIDPAAARRGIEAARSRGACILGAWLADVDPTALLPVGFERGWKPLWMSADLEAIAELDDACLGRALLRGVCGSARAAGARYALVNASPDGERLYREEGFVRVGTGITYWHHLA